MLSGFELYPRWVPLIDHLPRENRLCPLCNSNQVEDEIHFLFQCV